MEKIKETQLPSGKIMHYGIGAVIEKDGKYLLIDRAEKPYGFACITGHIRENETQEMALIREIKEEAGLEVLSHDLIFERTIKNRPCKSGKPWHHCYVYRAQIKEAPIKINHEVKSINWYEKDEIKSLKLEPLWKLFFKKIGII